MNRPIFFPFLFACFFVSGVSLLAAPPLWWSNGNPPVIDPLTAPNNHGAANIGQAKWMAKNALEALWAVDPTVASAVEADLVGAGKPLASWSPPTTPAEQTDQLAPLLIGQLKAISAPFYVHLQAADPTWLTAERVANGTENAGTFLPWSLTAEDDANKSVANIGQLKAVFSLRFESLVINIDSDEDGLPDAWELLYFGSESSTAQGSGDADDDGFTNLEEYQQGSDPNDAASNSNLLQFVVHTRLR